MGESDRSDKEEVQHITSIVTEKMTTEELFQIISSLRSRGEIKRFAKQIEKNAELLKVYRLLLQQHEMAMDLPIKKSIRMVLNRSSIAQQRKNPIHLDSPFTCAHCQKPIPIGGRMVRDHCPYCLRSLHLDIIPGDRAADCGGIMHPSRFEYNGDQIWIHYRCSKCTHVWRIRSHPDDQIPKSLSVADIPQ